MPAAKDAYIDRYRNDLTISLFNRPAWLSVVSESRWAVAGDASGPHLPYLPKQRYGISSRHHFSLTPFVQLMYPGAPPTNQGKRDAAVRRLLEIPPAAAFSHWLLGYEFTDWLPFYERGWIARLRYSYHLDLTTAPADRLAAYKYSLRRTVKQAPADIRIAPLPLEGAHARFERHLRKRGSGTGVSAAQFSQLYECFHPTGEFQLWGLFFQNQLLSSLCLAVDRGTAYCLLTERDAERDTVQAMHLLYHRVIEQCALNGLATFDFNGSMLPGVEPFMRAFGGARRTKYELIHYGNRFWKAGFALLGK